MVSVAALSDQFSYYILLHTVYTDRLRTEWKYSCNCTVTATVRCSHCGTDTALGEFFHLQSNSKLST